MNNIIFFCFFMMALLPFSVFANTEVNTVNSSEVESNKSGKVEQSINQEGSTDEQEKQLEGYNSQNITNWILGNRETFDDIINATVKEDSSTVWSVLPSDSDSAGTDVSNVKNAIVEEKKEAPQIAENAPFYIVKKNDTLYSVSKSQKIDLKTLKEINNLTSNKISVGQKLYLSKEGTTQETGVKKDNEVETVNIDKPLYSYYRVKKSDTYSSIAKAHKMSVKELLSINNLQPNDILSKDAILKVKANYTLNSKEKNSIGTSFEWPLVGRLLMSFGTQSLGMRNEGINISAKSGTAVKAVQDGVVIYVGNDLSVFGNLVLVQHSNEWISVYGHLDSYSINKGQKVKKGDTIARVGKTGNVNQTQLHFELRYNYNPVDPLKYLDSYR